MLASMLYLCTKTCYMKKKCPMLSLHDKQTLTRNLFTAGFNSLLIYQNMLHDKEKCPMLSLHDKPALTPNIFNAGFNALPIYRNMLYEKKVSNVEFAWQTNNKTKYLQCWLQCSTFMPKHVTRKRVVSNVEFARQAITDTKYLQCWLQFSTYIAKHVTGKRKGNVCSF